MNITDNTISIAGGTSGHRTRARLGLLAAGNHVIVGGRRRVLLEGIVSDNPGIDSVVIDTAEPDSITVAAPQWTSALSQPEPSSDRCRADGWWAYQPCVSYRGSGGWGVYLPNGTSLTAAA